MDNIKIDYIIPTYYESSMVKIGLDALCRQTRKDCLKVILVNDCSPYTDCNYQDVVDEYKDRLDITVVKTPYNSGPGMAMQYGVDAGTSDYYLIQDDDDCIASDDVIESYIEVLETIVDKSNIISIMGDSAICDKDFKILYKINEKTIIHARLFFRKFMAEHDIRYVDEVSWWSDDIYLNSLIMLESRNKYKDIMLDKLCYLYRPGLDDSVTHKMREYEIIFKNLSLDVELRKFIDKHKGIDKNKDVYRNINTLIFDAMYQIISLQCKKDVIREREWNILSEYRRYMINIIGDTDSSYSNDRKFNSYRSYALGHRDIRNSAVVIDKDVLEDLYYTYLSNEKTIFNCTYAELKEMV